MSLTILCDAVYQGLVKKTLLLRKAYSVSAAAVADSGVSLCKRSWLS